MNPRTFALCIMGAVALSGCIIIDADENGRENLHAEMRFGLPNLQSASIGQDSIAVAFAGACVTKQNIYPEVDKHSRRQYAIGFDYSDHDNCSQDSPGRADLEWTYEELGIPLDSTVRLLNAVAR